MTIPYSGSFLALILRWKGSLWKTIWKQVLWFMGLYYAINLVIRFALDAEQIETFMKIRKFCQEAQQRIPLLFLLGFYVMMMVTRWWSQFMAISWPDRFMIFITSSIRGSDDNARMYRRTIARWCNLMAVLCWRDLSLPLKKRFPTNDHLIGSGLMTQKELTLFENTQSAYGKWWLPAIWIANLLRKLQATNILSQIDVKQLIKEIDVYRVGFGTLGCYDWVSVPMVYTHVATIATFGYFFCAVIADQIVPTHDDLDTVIPFVTVLQFIFYIGWLKVGEDLMAPFGEDDDDFEMNYILDRNVHIAFLIADQLHGQTPPLEKDIYWDVKEPKLPHTRASKAVKQNIFDGHLADVKFSDAEMEQLPLSDENQDEIDANTLINKPIKNRLPDKQVSEGLSAAKDSPLSVTLPSPASSKLPQRQISPGIRSRTANRSIFKATQSSNQLVVPDLDDDDISWTDYENTQIPYANSNTLPTGSSTLPAGSGQPGARGGFKNLWRRATNNVKSMVSVAAGMPHYVEDFGDYDDVSSQERPGHELLLPHDPQPNTIVGSDPTGLVIRSQQQNEQLDEVMTESEYQLANDDTEPAGSGQGQRQSLFTSQNSEAIMSALDQGDEDDE